jgi:hypothetical protein
MTSPRLSAERLRDRACGSRAAALQPGPSRVVAKCIFIGSARMESHYGVESRATARADPMKKIADSVVPAASSPL